MNRGEVLQVRLRAALAFILLVALAGTGLHVAERGINSLLGRQEQVRSFALGRAPEGGYHLVLAGLEVVARRQPGEMEVLARRGTGLPYFRLQYPLPGRGRVLSEGARIPTATDSAVR